MRTDDSLLDGASGAGREIDRRTIAKGVAWTVPVVIVATAAPAAAGSGNATPASLYVVGTNSGQSYSATLSFAGVTGTSTVTLRSLTVDGTDRLSVAAPVKDDITPSHTDFPFSFTSTKTSNNQSLALQFAVDGAADRTYSVTLVLKKNQTASTTTFA
jgi:hypothetical protein